MALVLVVNVVDWVYKMWGISLVVKTPAGYLEGFV
jgi:hypothetical protein